MNNEEQEELHDQVEDNEQVQPRNLMQHVEFRRLPREVRDLLDERNPETQQYMNYAFTSAVTSGYNDPVTYREAMQQKDAKEWKKGIQKEFDDMERHGV